MRNLFIVIAAVLSTTICFSQNTYPSSGPPTFASGVNGDERALIIKDVRSGTNWNYVEWQFNDGSRDWILGRRHTTGAFT